MVKKLTRKSSKSIRRTTRKLNRKLNRKSRRRSNSKRRRRSNKRFIGGAPLNKWADVTESKYRDTLGRLKDSDLIKIIGSERVHGIEAEWEEALKSWEDGATGRGSPMDKLLLRIYNMVKAAKKEQKDVGVDMAAEAAEVISSPDANTAILEEDPEMEEWIAEIVQAEREGAAAASNRSCEA